ncbi:MAG: class I SAM-dependent methyltransferase [Pyrinomonadaceae bacterium]|nr:class I SAM-dependent methyltransferase [Pyrinomonadaceae bacterium]
MQNPSDHFGNIDIYLFDQILKNRFHPWMKILDAGCGGGRNLVYFLREKFDVYGVDQNKDAVLHVREIADRLNSKLPPENFRTASVENLPFTDAFFDWVLSSAVLHFAADEEIFNKMLLEMWRVLKPGGVLFARLASTIGIESKVEKIAGRRFALPDGSERFLVDLETLLELTAKLGGELMEPVKTTNVQNLRSMTTWVIRKS